MINREPSITAQTILSAILPEVQDGTPGGRPYHPKHCLAIYYPASVDDAPEDELTLEFPALLVGQSAIAPFGVGCTMLGGFPKRPPGGSIIIGTWDELCKEYPDEFEDLDKPDSKEGYLLKIDHHVLLAGVDRRGCLMGAQTLIQILALAGEGPAPAMTILDYPSIHNRGCVYDLRSEVPSLERLMRIAGFLSSFKGNRLHVVLDSRQPTAELPGRGSMAEDDIHEFSMVCQEYGISLIPWGYYFDAMSEGSLGLEDVLASTFELVSAFECSGIGLGGRIGDDETRFQVLTLIDALLEELPEESSLYLAGDTFEELYRDTPGSVPPRVVGLVNWSPQQSSQADMIQRTSNPLALHLPHMSRGYVTCPPKDAAALIDACMQDAYLRVADEIGFSSHHSGKGHSWEAELSALIGCISLGWRHRIGATEAANRFSKLAYGQLSDRVQKLLRQVANVFPAPLRQAESEHLRQIAFGFPAAPEDWTMLCGMDWTRLDQQIREAMQLLNECCQAAPRNAENLHRIGVGLQALQMIGLLVIGYGQASICHQAAMNGNRDKLAAGGQILSSLAESVPGFINVLTKASEGATPCAEELAQLTRLRADLNAASECFLHYATTTDEIPPLAELGIPEFNLFPDEEAEEDNTDAAPTPEESA